MSLSGSLIHMRQRRYGGTQTTVTGKGNLFFSGIGIQGIGNNDVTVSGYDVTCEMMAHTSFGALSSDVLASDTVYPITVTVVHFTPPPTTAAPTTATPTRSPTTKAPTQPPTKGVVLDVCRDSIAAWVDSDGDGCFAYKNNLWCTSTGGYGAQWGTTGDTFQTYVLIALLTKTQLVHSSRWFSTLPPNIWCVLISTQ